MTRPGGVVRITESDMTVESSSPALTRLFDLALAALTQAGHFFTPTSQKRLDGQRTRTCWEFLCGPLAHLGMMIHRWRALQKQRGFRLKIKQIHHLRGQNRCPVGDEWSSPRICRTIRRADQSPG